MLMVAFGLSMSLASCDKEEDIIITQNAGNGYTDNNAEGSSNGDNSNTPSGSTPGSASYLGNGRYVVNGVEFKMIDVQGGTFRMGNDDSRWSFEKPEHSVTLDSYSIGETEVTQALWVAVMDENPAIRRCAAEWKTLPVERVSWEDCQKFIEKLNQMTNQNFRLPTEAEWEFAARGGNKSKGYEFAGSNYINEVAWYANTTGAHLTNPVATKKANELGLYDMSGNVREFCQDWYDKEYYAVSPANNPKGAVSGSTRVARGGSVDDGTNCRVSHRFSFSPTTRNNYTGLRLAQ